MGKRGPKTGQSKHRHYVIQRLADSLYYAGVNQYHQPVWGPREKATLYWGIRAARTVVGMLEARREPVQSRRRTKEYWRIEAADDPTWEAYWPW